MQKVSRNNIFETNSSSVHSLSMCSSEEYQRWKSGELFFQKYKNIFLTKEELVQMILDKEWEISTDLNDDDLRDLADNDIYTFESYDDSCNDFESFSDEYTTKSGETVVAFGYFGQDG